MVFAQSGGSVNSVEYLRPFVKYQEKVAYDRAALEWMHQRAKRATKEHEKIIQLEFQAYQSPVTDSSPFHLPSRTFKLRLSRDTSAFARDFEITGKATSEPADVSFIYSGVLQDEPGSFCHGAIINGLFEGFIRTKNGTYYMEAPGAFTSSATSPGQTLIHHESDIDYSILEDPSSASLMRGTHQILRNFQQELKLKGETLERQRRSLDYSRTSCLLYLQADYLFYQRFGTIEAVIAQIASYIKAVNAIYEGANFDGIRHIDFKVKTLNIIQENDPSDSMESPFIGPEMLLMLHSKSNWNSYCLSYLLTDRDYSGILGIAFNGQAGDLGGICSKHRQFRDGEASLNTGLITLQKYGQYLPPRILHLTLAHELGHSLGAPHDESEECARFSFDTTHGNYLMFNYATDGWQYNNDKFSPCSIEYIGNILRAKKDRCFVETDRPICGNQIVDPGEECDAGNNDSDPCCYAAKEPNGFRCRLKPGVQCSSSQGLCCSHECVYKRQGELCHEETDCTFESTCSGLTAECAAPLPKASYTLCSMGTRICLNGLCLGSLCVKHGLEQCDCVSTSRREKCHLCCQQPGQVHTCASTSSALLERYFNGTHIPLTPGTPCRDRMGYCDKFHVCRLVDEDGPIARVKNFILDFIELEDISAWMKTRWWAVLLMILTLAAVMAGTVFLFGRTLDSEKEEKSMKCMVKKNSFSKQPEKRQTLIYWEHEELYVETTHQEYETII
ncbi:disintegrin and metalloproteinase domain-containing protein 10-like [Gopherus flavomarginatus]|uniref:disintegrin and metalloproteinase domain-containing protein 10-like n=1 Tax=Gopherus flavomarginatus TaxID=286002 RepID=UPI0021CBD715|nr:disintegrin and metalloproteinase domain-containing protein 10-like [Gopherus flavomarginatus]